MFQTDNLYQNDPEWKSIALGNSSETIGKWGCLLTAATMMLNGLGYQETPETVNEKMKKKNGFQEASLIPSALPSAYPNLIYKGMQPCESSPAPITEIDAAVAAGEPVIVQVDWDKQAGIQTHYVLIKEKRGNDYVVYDPYKYSGDSPEKEVLLTERYKYQGKKIETEIKAVLWFEGVGTAPEPERVPVPANRFIIYVAVDDLAFRAGPSIGDFLLKRLAAATELISLENKSTTKKKIGQQGQWLHVQDPDEDQGYVAAWYLSLDKEPEPIPTPDTPASDGSLALYPTAQLSFRTQPVIADNTLIRYLSPTEKLIAVEPLDQVTAKVGATGQWLKVRDASNQEGYVAAWYVEYANPVPPQPETTTTPPSPSETPITVRTTAEVLAFRKQPIISASTLIRWLPINTQLAIAETGGEQKIGANNQWLKVKDAAGIEGYVAAWFVAR
jgi:hypothetical protein